MLLRLTHPAVTIDDYIPLLPSQLVENLVTLARQVQHLRFVHINSTAVGGGVAEILQSLVPFMNSLGVETERIVINPEPEFFLVTKQIHNMLQGAEGELTPQEWETYHQTLRQVAQDIQARDLKADVWFLHDPQILPLAQVLPRETDEVRLWVCHIDLTAPNRRLMESLQPLTRDYDGLLFSLQSYVPDGLGREIPIHIVPPAIDPLTAKNMPLGHEEACKLVAAMGVDPDRPLVTQVSRFDLWKDPWGVVQAFRLARKGVPGLQLAMLGLSQAADDPEGVGVLQSVTELAAEDPDIHLYFDSKGLPGSIDQVVNAFQVASSVVIQKSTREGFGLTVSEAMWKGRPVIGGNVGGIRLQIDDGKNGYLVNSPEECAQRIVRLLRAPKLRARLGQAAREKVRQNFLLPRLALDYLQAVADHLPEKVKHPGSNGNGTNNFEKLEILRV